MIEGQAEGDLEKKTPKQKRLKRSEPAAIKERKRDKSKLRRCPGRMEKGEKRSDRRETVSQGWLRRRGENSEFRNDEDTQVNEIGLLGYEVYEDDLARSPDRQIGRRPDATELREP